MSDEHANELKIALQLVATDLCRESDSTAYRVEMPRPGGGTLVFLCVEEHELAELLGENKPKADSSST